MVARSARLEVSIVEDDPTVFSILAKAPVERRGFYPYFDYEFTDRTDYSSRLKNGKTA